MTREVSSPISQAQSDKQLTKKSLPSTKSDDIKVVVVVQVFFIEKAHFFSRVRQGLKLCEGNDRLQGRIYHQSNKFDEQSVEISHLKKILQSQEGTIAAQEKITVENKAIKEEETWQRKQSNQKQIEKFDQLQRSQIELSKAATSSQPHINRSRTNILRWIDRLLETVFALNRLGEKHKMLGSRVDEREAAIKSQDEKIQSMRQKIKSNFDLIETSEKEIERMGQEREQSTEDSERKTDPRWQKAIEQEYAETKQVLQSFGPKIEEARKGLESLKIERMGQEREQSTGDSERKTDPRWQKAIEQEYAETKQVLQSFGPKIEEARKGLERLKQEILEQGKPIEKIDLTTAEKPKKIDNQSFATSKRKESIDKKKISQRAATKSSSKRQPVPTDLDKIIDTQRTAIEGQKQILSNLKKMKKTVDAKTSKTDRELRKNTKRRIETLTEKFKNVRESQMALSETFRCKEIERQFEVIRDLQTKIDREKLLEN